MKPILNDVSDTALWVAVYRAKETTRPDALFKDPLAGLLAGEKGNQIADKMSASIYTGWSVIIRTHIIDSYFKNLISQGVETVINLGCGLDTRPYRLDLPSNLSWIEVDFPHMIQYKTEKLKSEKPKCHLQRIGLDLGNIEERKKLFDRLNSESKNAVILTEGVTPYLSEAEVASLADALHEQKNFKHWIVDYMAPGVMKYMKSKKRMKQMTNAPFKFNPGDWFSFYSDHGWKVREINYTAEVSIKLGRKFPMPWYAKILVRFAPKEKVDEFKKATAYVLMEPE